MPDPTVSIIVCTRDRPEQLLRCVSSVVAAMQHAPNCPTEILVIENKSAPSLKLREADVMGAAPGVRLITLSEGGLALARNAGMRAATGQFFVFTDDDCTMAPDYFVDLARHIASQPGDVIIGGRVALADGDDLPFTIKTEAAPQDYDVSIHPGGFIQGCNFVVPRGAAESIGDFDTRYGAGALFLAGEDTDYLIRAQGAKIPLRYVPDMCVLHHHGRKTIAEIEHLNRSYCYANGALYGKHFRRLWLMKHLYWTMGAAVREATGGPPFNTTLGLTWRDVLRANLAGLWAFSRHSLRRRGRK